MSDRDRETWERFAAAIAAGVCANPNAASINPEALREGADRLLAATKQRWPEKTITAGCETVTPATAADETVTEPDPGEGYRWVEPRSPGCPGETLRHDDECKPAGGGSAEWACTNAVGDECVTRHFYRRRIDAAPEPSSGACQLPAETTPRADEVRSEVRSDPVMYSIVWDGDDTPDPECCEDTVVVCSHVLDDAGGKGKVVPLYAVPVDAAREIAAARREAEEARAACERLRIKQEEREAIEFTMTNLDWPPDAAQFAILARCLGPSCTMPEHAKKSALRGLLARHDKGGAT
jgi:hypothetical protein